MIHENRQVHENLNKGTPQGSVIGSLLWNIAMHNLLTKTYPKGTRVIAYAGDVAIICYSNNRAEMERISAKALTVTENWSKRLKLEISIDKTHHQIFR